MGVDAVRVLEQTGVLEYHLKASCEKLKMFTTHPQAKTKITKQRELQSLQRGIKMQS